MIRIRQTYLESFRRVVCTEYGNEQELIDSIKGKDISNWKMNVGTGWHYALARAKPDATCDGQNPSSRYGEYWFSDRDITASIAQVGPGLHEVPGQRLFGNVLVTGTADHLRGLVLQDHKAKFSTADARDYESSLQWRLYLLIHHAAVLRYNLFEFKDPDEGNFCQLRNVVSFQFWPYAGMEQDCMSWIAKFVDWAASRHLLGYLGGERIAA